MNQYEPKDLSHQILKYFLPGASVSEKKPFLWLTEYRASDKDKKYRVTHNSMLETLTFFIFEENTLDIAVTIYLLQMHEIEKILEALESSIDKSAITLPELNFKVPMFLPPLKK